MNPTPQFLVADEDGVLTPHPLGLVECSNDQYHGGPGVSKSHLDAIAGASPLHYWHKYINPNRERAEPSQALIMGSAIHSIVLEPDLFTGEYITVPEDAPKRATKAQINAKKTAINGHLDHRGCQSWNNAFGFNNKPGNYVPSLVINNDTGALAPVGAPRNNCRLPAALVYDPVTNPTGTRCGDADLATTEIYTHVLDERLRALVMTHHPLARKD